MQPLRDALERRLADGGDNRVVDMAGQRGVFGNLVILAGVDRGGVMFHTVDHSHLQCGVNLTAGHRDRRGTHAF
ncbi:hypothetical protein D3C73_1319640 [compost metagenome]